MALGDMTQVYNVNFPVGHKMPNVRDDVMLVQTLMKMANYVRFSPHGPVERSSKIAIDGFYGPQTERLIKAFEVHWRSKMRFIVSDGIVESAPRDGFTKTGILYKIIHMNRAAFEQADWRHKNLPFDSETHPTLRPILAKGAVAPPRPPRPF